jgi:hypothetical protein
LSGCASMLYFVQYSAQFSFISTFSFAMYVTTQRYNTSCHCISRMLSTSQLSWWSCHLWSIICNTQYSSIFGRCKTGEWQKMLISFLYSLLLILCYVMYYGTTAFVVAFIVLLCMAVNMFRINFYSYVRVRYLPFGCVVWLKRWVHAFFEWVVGISAFAGGLWI